MTVRVCLGGTFNAVHNGHIALLKRAFAEGDMVFIGLTSDAMASRERAVPVKDYATRLRNLTGALKDISAGKGYLISEICDEYGPAAQDDFDVIVVSEETLPGAESINSARKKSGLRPLRIVVVDMVIGPDGKKISSTKQMLEKSDSEQHNT